MYKIEVDAESLSRLPEPTGYKMVIALPKVNDTTSGGVYIPDELKGREETATIIGKVIKKGPDAYGDAKKFPSGSWCEEGDFVIFRSYAGTRFRVNKQEFRLINDDTIEAVVDDPTGYERAF